MSGFKSKAQQRGFYGQRYVSRDEARKLKEKLTDKTNHTHFHNLGDNKKEKVHFDRINVEKAKNGHIIMKSVSLRNGKRLVKIVT